MPSLNLNTPARGDRRWLKYFSIQDRAGLSEEQLHRLFVISHNWACEICDRITAPMPVEEVFDWCVNNIVFADTEVTGPFNPVGREFLRDIINDADDPDCKEQSVCCATGVGKTLAIMARVIWKIVHRPPRGLHIMPTTKGPAGSENYVSSRLIPCLIATRATRDLMPDIQQRLFMNSKKVRFNGAHFDFIGSNSSSQLKSNRCSHVDVDEIDELKGRLGNEAGARALIGERTEGVRDSQIFQSSTPSVETGQMWRCLMRSDFRRRFLPCPHCNSEARHRHLLQEKQLVRTTQPLRDRALAILKKYKCEKQIDQVMAAMN